MSLIPTIYSSSDPGAPQLTGQAGSFVALLDAVLVGGYGFGGDAKAGLGWSIEYTGTNRRVYRNSFSNGSGGYLRVDDAGSLFASVTGYASMSDVDTGVDRFPTVGQASNGAVWPKSSTADAVARKWWLIGTETAFYLFIASDGQEVGNEQTLHFAGDIIPFSPADVWTFAVTHYNRSSWSGGYDEPGLLRLHGNMQDSVSAFNARLVMARGFSGAAGEVGRYAAVMSSAFLMQIYAGFQGYSSSGFPFPNPVAGLMTTPMMVSHLGVSVRGRMPGLLIPLHNGGINNMQIFEGENGQASGSILLCKSARMGTSFIFPRVLFETALPWH